MATQPILSTPLRLPWDEFVTRWYWPQGEHVAIIGPIGSGKSTLMRSILELRSWVVVLASKKKDSTYDGYLAAGYERIGRWPPPKPKRGQQYQRTILWPKIKTVSDLDALGPVFKKCLNDVFVDENWCVGMDDLFYLSQMCRVPKGIGKATETLSKQIAALNYQVRSMGVTLVSCLQRPAWVPRSTWDQASHAFIRNLSDIDDIRTLRGLSKISTRELEVWLNELGVYEWLYLPVARSDRLSPLIVSPPC